MSKKKQPNKAKAQGKVGEHWDQINRISAHQIALSKVLNNQAIVSCKAVKSVAVMHQEEPLVDVSDEQLLTLLKTANQVSKDTNTHISNLTELRKTHQNKSGGARSESQEMESMAIGMKYQTLADDVIDLTSDGLGDLLMELIRIEDANPNRTQNVTSTVREAKEIVDTSERKVK